MARNVYGKFNDTVQISGVDINIHQRGSVFYVCNNTVLPKNAISGSNGNSGATPDKPLATIAGALALCIANRGDKIILLPGHAETVSAAAGIAISVAGVTIIGVGAGSQRPTITLGTANTATVTVTANDIAINNVLFVANFLNIATCLSLTTAKNFTLENVEFRDTSAILNFVLAVSTDSTANHADGLTIDSSTYNGLGTSAATSLVKAGAAEDRWTVTNNVVDIQGTTATTGALILATAHALTHARVDSNNAHSPITTSAGGGLIVAGSGGSGVVSNNYLYVPAASTAILITTGTGLGFLNNYVSRSAVDTSGLLLPAASS